MIKLKFYLYRQHFDTITGITFDLCIIKYRDIYEEDSIYIFGDYSAPFHLY